MATNSKLYYIKMYRADSGFYERYVVADTIGRAMEVSVPPSYEVTEARIEKQNVLVA